MRPRRIYLPLTHAQVRELADERRLAAPVQGYAAGSPGRVDSRFSPAGSQEEAEYFAFRAAAADAGGLDEGSRRVIASADAPEGTFREVPGSASGGLSGPVPIVLAEDLPVRAIASLHIDEVGDESDRTTEGDPDALEPDLLWYDITEIDTVLAGLDS